ncbi:MAG: preprotein translocase subunit SecY [Promethearchaeota archaeon]
MGRFLRVFTPLIRIMPEVKPPEKKVTFGRKLFWTLLVLLIYLIMSNIPLWGVERGGGLDYLYWWRVLFASTRGSLVELGIMPIVTAGLILQILAGSKIIQVNFADPVDRALFTGTQKVLAIIMTGFQAVAYIGFGAYGALTFELAVGVFLQLFFAGIIIILLDEMLQKGWGLGSGVSLFIMAGVTSQIFWNMFSPVLEADGFYRGAVLALVQSVIAGNPLGAIYRQNSPDIIGFLATVLVVVLVVYFETVRVEIPLKLARYRGYAGRYPIRFLYVSNIPVILVQAVYSNVLLVSQGVWSAFNPDNNNVWLNLFGTFRTTAEGQVVPTGGFVYYLTPPRGLIGANSVTADPLHAFIYLGIFVLLCAGLAVIWVEVSGITSRDVAQQLLSSELQIPGYRRSPVIYEKVLSRYIPTVTILGGMFVGLLTVFADFLGALGTGMGVLLTVGIAFQYLRTIAEEQAGALAQILGRST